MKFTNYLEDVLGSPEKVRLLRLFLRYPTKGFTANEAARLTGLSAMGAWRIAQKFEHYGIISKRRVGKSDDWRLQPGHFLVRKLGVLAEEDAMEELRRRIQGALRGVVIEKIILFGSIARHEERPDSDLDVWVLVKTEKDRQMATEKLLDLSVTLLSVFSNRLAPIIYTERQWKEKQKANLALLDDIKKDGIILFERSSA